MVYGCAVFNMNSESKLKRKKLFLSEAINMEDSHFSILTKQKYSELLQEIKSAKLAVSKTTLQYRRLKRFAIIEIGGVEKIISKSNNSEILYYLTVDEIYDVIETIHIAIGHGGRDKLRKETGKNYANITVSMINLFLSLCEVCNCKKRKRSLCSKPKLHLDTEFESRCHIDFIDMQNHADGANKYIMVYQDHFTKFVQLRSLETKCADEVAYNILNIFLTFGAPCILNSANDREFVNDVIKRLKEYWPELNLINGKPHQSLRFVEQCSQDIKNMVVSWLQDNKTSKWSDGLLFIQFMKNRAWHSGIKQSPFKAMFGMEPRVGLLSTPFPLEIISTIQNEEDLNEMLIKQENTTDGCDVDSSTKKYCSICYVIHNDESTICQSYNNVKTKTINYL